MARKSKIRFEWSEHNESLLVIRDKGKITWDEMYEALANNDAFQGYMFVMSPFIVDRDRLNPIGWSDENEDEGDCWKLYTVDDGEPCPVCSKLMQHTYCPDCGKYVFPGMM